MEPISKDDMADAVAGGIYKVLGQFVGALILLGLLALIVGMALSAANQFVNS